MNHFCSADDLVGAVVEPSSTSISLQLQHPRQQASLATCSTAIAAAALSSNDGTHGLTVNPLHGPGSSSRASSSSHQALQQHGPSLQCLAAASLALAPVDLILTAAAAAGLDESSSCGTFSEFLPRSRATLSALHRLLSQQRVQLQVRDVVWGWWSAVWIWCVHAV
jgi:hypothetical protein